MSQPASIQIICPACPPRLRYTLDLLFVRLLGVNWTWADESSPHSAGTSSPVIYYHPFPPEGAAFIPCSRFFEETSVNPGVPDVGPGTVPQLFYLPIPGAIVDFDLFAAVFFMAAEYPQADPLPLDKHGRVDESKSPLAPTGIYELPVVHLWAELLREKMNWDKPRRQFSWEITVDVDQPWQFAHKPLSIQLGGMVKDLFRRKFDSLKKRLSHDADPFDTYDQYLQLAGAEKLVFFFLSGTEHPNDSRFPLSMKPYTELVQRLSKVAGLRLGVHPSYLSSENENLLRSEVKQFADVAGQSGYSRQHYLRYRNPQTFRQLIAAGIRHEYSLCSVSYAGFKTGMCIPYPWFDLEENKTTSLLLHPAAVMDRSLQQYLGLTPDAAIEKLRHLIEQVRGVNGHFVAILHNETLSESGEWKGWSRVVKELIKDLQAAEHES